MTSQAELLGLKSKGRTSEGIEVTKQSLKDELDLDIDELLGIPPDQLVGTLQEKMRFTDESLDRLAGIFLIIADELYNRPDKQGKSKQLYMGCLKIYQYLEKASATYSLDRHFRIERIEKLV